MSESKELSRPGANREEVSAIIERNNLSEMLESARHDKAVANAVIDHLDKNGDPDGIAEQAGDMAMQARLAMIQQYVGGDKLASRLTARKMGKMHRELCGPDPTPLESLLVERITLCWFHLNSLETLYAQNAANMRAAQDDHYQKQIDRAHKRYLPAIKALAQVRRLQLPSVQVNIGEKQVNIGTVRG